MFPSAQRRSEVGINAVADDKIEGTEDLMLRLVLTSATQTAINNAGNIFFQDTLNIRVIDVTGSYKLDSTILCEEYNSMNSISQLLVSCCALGYGIHCIREFGSLRKLDGNN